MGAGQQILLASATANSSGPSSLSGLELWLPGNSITGLSNGGTISTVWPDMSGHSRDATAVQKTTRKPIWLSASGPNSTPCVELISSTGDGGYFTLPNFISGFTAGDYFVVVQIDADPPPSDTYAAPPLSAWGTGADDDYFTFSSDGKIYDGWGSTSRKTTVNPVTSLTAWGVYEVTAATGTWKNFLNGSLLFDNGGNIFGFSTVPKIAHTVTNDKYMKGRIAEIIFYSRILSASERTNTINPYLNAKYGFSL